MFCFHDPKSTLSRKKERTFLIGAMRRAIRVVWFQHTVMIRGYVSTNHPGDEEAAPPHPPYPTAR